MEKTRRLSEMVTARVRGEFQNANAGRARSERLPARRFAGVRPIRDSANTQSAVEDVVFPGRRSLGAKTAELTLVVQNGE